MWNRDVLWKPLLFLLTQLEFTGVKGENKLSDEEEEQLWNYIDGDEELWEEGDWDELVHKTWG